MPTAITGYLKPEEIAKTQASSAAMAAAGASLPPPTRPFVFLAAFDGTNNNKGDLPLSGSTYQTNVANIFDQAEIAKTTNPNLKTGYYPGVGTGGENGGLIEAAFSPTKAVHAAAEKALKEFTQAADDYLSANPQATYADISATAVGFSRGGVTAIVFAQLLNERGLVLPNGTIVAPPGVPVYGLAPIDPVKSGIEGNLAIPPNVKGDVLVVVANREDRAYFESADFSTDARVVKVAINSNHVGAGGGYDKNGTAAAVLEGVTGYLQKQGAQVADVPPENKFDPSKQVATYSEAYQVAHNGDILTNEDGTPRIRWPLAGTPDERESLPIPATQDTHDPRDPHSVDAVNGSDLQSDQYFNIANLKTPDLASHFAGNTGGAYGAGQLAGFDVLPLNESTSFLVNADGDIAGEIHRLPSGYYQVKDLSGNAVYVNGKDGSVVASDTYTRAESAAQASQTASTLGLMNSILGLQHWEQMSELQRTVAIASIYNVADRLTGGSLPGELGGAAAVLGLANALDKGDIGGITYSGIAVVDFFGNGIASQTIGNALGMNAADVLPGLGLVLAIDSGDPVSIASAALAFVPGWGQVTSAALSVLNGMGFFGDDPDIPMQEGIAHAEWDTAGNTHIVIDQDTEGGGATAAAWIRSLVYGLQDRLSQSKDADGNPYALVPGLLPAIGFQYDPDGFNLANGTKGFMVLRWTDDNGQLQTRYYDGAGNRGNGTGDTLAGDFMTHANKAIAPQWLVQTVLAHDNQGHGLHLPSLDASLPQQLSDGLRQVLQAVTFNLPDVSSEGSLAEASSQNALIDALIDIDGDGYMEHAQWLGANQQTLAVDSNGDGLIGTDELLSLDGSFARHSMDWLDANGDKLLDARDPAFPALRLWLDINSDASSSSETQTLAQAGIVAIDFASSPPAIVRTDGSRTTLSIQTLTGDILGVQYQAVTGGVLQFDEQPDGLAAATLHAINTREFDGQSGHVHGGDPVLVDVNREKDGQTLATSTVDAGDNRLITATANSLATQSTRTTTILAENDTRLGIGVAGRGITGQGVGQTAGNAQIHSGSVVYIPAKAQTLSAPLREATQSMVRSAEAGGLMPLIALAVGAGAAFQASEAPIAPSAAAPNTPIESIDWQTWDGSLTSIASNSFNHSTSLSENQTISHFSSAIGVDGTVVSNPSPASFTASDIAPTSNYHSLNATVEDGQAPGGLPSAFSSETPLDDHRNGHHSDSSPGIATSNTVLDFPQTGGEQAVGVEDGSLRFLETLLLSNDSTLNTAAYPDRPSLRISSVFAPVHGSVSLQVNAHGATEVVFLPDANYHGPASFDYTVTDQYGLSTSARVNLNIVAVNDAPVTRSESASGSEDTGLLFTAASLMVNDSDVDADVDGDVLRITRVGLATHGHVFLQSDGTVRFEPDTNYNGPAQFSYWVGDRDPVSIAAGIGYETQSMVRLTVLAVNDLPVVTGEVMGSDEDIVLNIHPALLLANDTDVDADPFNAGNTEPHQLLRITAVGDAQHGSIALLSGGTLQFIPEHHYFGAAGFSYTVDDGHGGQVTGQVVINLASVNDAPDVQGEVIAFNEDEVQTVTQADLLSNDTDADNPHSDLRVVSVENATHGTVSLNLDGSIRFVPATNYFGPAQFTYTVTDGVGGFTVGLASLQIAAVNDAPRLQGEDTALDEDTQVRFTSSTLLFNDTDIDSPHTDLTITGVGNASHGSVQLIDSEIVFTPDQNFSGTASFDYTVSDSVGGSMEGVSQARVSLTFNQINDAPVTNGELLMGKRGVSYTLTQAALLANDTDAESPGALRVSAISNAQHGTAVLNANGSVSFTPESGYAGRGSFDYTVQDPEGASSIATASIDFSRVNLNPVATDDSFIGYEDIAFSITQAQLLINDTDPDATGLSALWIDAVGQASNGNVSQQTDGSVRFTPATDYSGGASFAYRVNDGEGGQTWATAYLNVQSVNDAPIIEEILYGRPLYGYQASVRYGGSEEGFYTVYLPVYDQAQATSLVNVRQLLNRVEIYSYYDQDGRRQAVYQYPELSPSYYRNGNLRPVGAEALDATRYESDGYTQVVDDPYRQNGTIQAYDPDGNSAGITFSVVSSPQHGHAWTNQYTPKTAPNELDHTQAGSYWVGERGAWQYYSQRGDGYGGGDPFTVVVSDGGGAVAYASVGTTHFGSSASGGGGKKPVTLDLNGNGLEYVGLDDSTAYFDVNNDGWRERLAWVARDDALLALDIGSDGVIDRFEEISFTHYQPGAKSDLEGLVAFDSNGNGLLDRLDSRWQEFGAWQDRNGDGATQAGEFRMLDDIGITQISLHSDHQLRQPAQGVTELGQSRFTWADGRTGAVGDVVLAVQAVGESPVLSLASNSMEVMDVSRTTTVPSPLADQAEVPASTGTSIRSHIEDSPSFWPTSEQSALLMVQMVNTVATGWHPIAERDASANALNPLVFVPPEDEDDIYRALAEQQALWEQTVQSQAQQYQGAA